MMQFNESFVFGMETDKTTRKVEKTEDNEVMDEQEKEINRTLRIYAKKDSRDTGWRVMRTSFATKILAKFQQEMKDAAPEEKQTVLVIYDGVQEFASNLIYFEDNNTILELLEDDAIDNDMPIMVLLGLIMKEYTIFAESASLAGLLQENAFKLRTPKLKIEIIKELQEKLPYKYKEITARYFEKYINTLENLVEDSDQMSELSKKIKIVTEIDDELYKEVVVKNLHLFDQTLRPDLLDDLVELDWFSDMTPEMKLKTSLIFAYTLNKAEYAQLEEHRQLLSNTINYLLDSDYKFLMKELKKCSGHCSSELKEVTVKTFEDSKELDHFVQVLAHEVAHALSETKRGDSVTYYLEELRAYQVGYFAQFGELMKQWDFLEFAKWIFSSESYPDMLRAWEQDSEELLPADWYIVNEGLVRFDHDDVRKYPRNFEELLIFLGFNADSVELFQRTKNPDDLSFHCPILKQPIIGRDGSVVFFNYKDAGKSRGIHGKDANVLLNLPLEQSN